MRNIKEIKLWSADSVRRVCVDNRLFTHGDNEEYIRMMALVERLSPSTENIYRVAEIIFRHSEDQTVGNVMHLLANMAVVTAYDLEEE